MVRDIPLARALHAACEIGQEIPVELYNAGRPGAGLRDGAEGPRRRSTRGVHTMAEPAMTDADAAAHASTRQSRRALPNRPPTVAWR